jgi:hypothetical protein
MAPEQWEDEAQADARCDVFALGATLYHLLAGRPPFEGEDFFEIADKALAGDFRPLREAAPGVSQGLDRIVTTMLSASVRYRYGSMEDCVRDLEGLARGQAPELPRIERASGPALLLADRTQLVLGRGVDSDERLDHPSVANTHAEVRREAKGYVLCDLRSETGTFVEGERVTFVPRLLEDGDRIRLGQVELVLRDPRGRTGGAAFLQDLVRRELPGAVVAALVATADPRAIATLLELLSPDRSLSAEVAAVLTPLLGEAVARQVVAYVQREELRRVDWARSHLAAIAGAPHDDWLSWWWGRRGQHPVQIGATRPARGLALEVAAGAAEPTRLALDDAGVVLVGSDPRCHLRCAGPRLRLTLLRLHRRFLARAEPGAGVRHGGRPFVGAVLDVGDVLELGAVSLRLSAAAPRPQEQTPRGRHVLAPLACEALRELTHPAVASGLAAALGEPDQDAWIVPVARDLFQGDARGERAFDQQVRAQLTARAKRAQAALPQILGREVSASDLAEIGEGLGPQVVPRGWLAETR